MVQAISGQVVQQHFGLLQVGGVKALGEPAVDRRQQLAGFGKFALTLPQPSQTCRRPQFPGLRPLAAGIGEGFDDNRCLPRPP
jgi:hypothetical protein